MQAVCNTFEYINAFGNRPGAELVDVPDGQAVGMFVVAAEHHHPVVFIHQPDEGFKFFLAALSSRTRIFMPWSSLSNALLGGKTFWSVEIPASMYFFASAPRKPGAWGSPSTGLPYFWRRRFSYILHPEEECRKIHHLAACNGSRFRKACQRFGVQGGAGRFRETAAGTQPRPEMKFEGNRFDRFRIQRSMLHTLAISK